MAVGKWPNRRIKPQLLSVLRGVKRMVVVRGVLRTVRVQALELWLVGVGPVFGVLKGLVKLVEDGKINGIGEFTETIDPNFVHGLGCFVYRFQSQKAKVPN